MNAPLDGSYQTSMNTDEFRTAYDALEERMRALADSEGSIYLPNPRPSGPVDYVLIAMEPSLGAWARSAVDARRRIQEGFRNFIESVETTLVHFSAQTYLCGLEETYHITDLAKGAMLVQDAQPVRMARYRRWYPLFQQEVALVAKPDAGFVAFGAAVDQHLTECRFPRRYIKVLHYSGQAAGHRRKSVAGDEQAFEAFRHTVSREDLLLAAQRLLARAEIPRPLWYRLLSQVERADLSRSRLELIFHYKRLFEALRLRRHAHFAERPRAV